jgi:hypothetical protein
VTTRKPRVDALVPTHAIDRYLMRVHVCTPDEVVVAAIEDAPGLKTDARWTSKLLRQGIRYAVWRHHRNLAQALAVGLR